MFRLFSIQQRTFLLLTSILAAVAALFFYSGSVQAQTTWVQQWSDEFNGAAGSGVDTTQWKYDTGQGVFGTGEIETMTTSTANVHQDGAGHLVITALRDSSGNWTSGRIETQRSDFQPPAGGMMLVESSLQQPNVSGAAGAGYWPAFWMLGATLRTGGTWPSVGEWDVLEDINGLSSVYGTLHCGVDPGGPCNETTGIGSGQRACSGCQTAMHTYGIQYDKSVSPEQLRWYLDGNNYFTINATQVDATTWNNATHRGNFIIYDLAMGGGFPNCCGESGPTSATASGGSMIIDWVRVFYSGSGSPTNTVQPPTNTPKPAPTNTPSGSCGTTNLALNKTATASSLENSTFPASNAVDGNTGTRWSSAFSDPQWLQVDLGSTQSICKVTLMWEAAYGKSYQIQTSNDATNWTTIYSTTTGPGGTENLNVSGSGRYIRMYGTVRGTPYGYSLWEFQVFGGGSGGPTSTPAPTKTNTPGPTATSGGTSHSNVVYVLSGGTLSFNAGSGASADTIASAGGANYDGTPHSQLTYTISGVSGTFNSGATAFNLYVDAGTTVGNGTQVRVSYDFNGDGVWDRVETFHYFATDPVVGYEDYTQSAGIESSSGSFANMTNGKIKIEVWNAIGNGTSTLRTNATSANGQQSTVTIPFSSVTG